MPFAPLSLRVARAAFLILAAGLFGYAIGKKRPYLWPLLLGIPFYSAVRSAQWSPLLTAAMLLPTLGWLAAVKPNVGIAMLAGARSKKAAYILIGGGLALVLLSFLVRPGWPGDWRAALSSAPHFKPLILRPAGVIMLLALVRWRDPDARLLLGLSLIPQTGLFYEALPAGLVARSRMEALALSLCTHVGWQVGQLLQPTLLRGDSFTEQAWFNGTFALWFALAPALFLTLRRRTTEPAPSTKRTGDVVPTALP